MLRKISLLERLYRERKRSNCVFYLIVFVSFFRVNSYLLTKFYVINNPTFYS